MQIYCPYAQVHTTGRAAPRVRQNVGKDAVIAGTAELQPLKQALQQIEENTGGTDERAA